MKENKPGTFKTLDPETLAAMLERSNLTQAQWDGLPAWEQVSRVRAWRSPA